MSVQQAGGPPIFDNMPAVVLALAAAITAVSGAVFVLPNTVSWAIIDSAAVSIGYDHPQPLGSLAPYALHAFVHVTWAHLALNMVALLAFGAGAARGLGDTFWGAAAVLLLFFLSVVGGAVTEAALRSVPEMQLAGASGGVFGLIAGSVYMYADGGRGRPPGLFSLAYAKGAAPWVLINLLLPVGSLIIPDLSVIAWKAHLGGFAVGAVLFPVLRAWAAPPVRPRF